MPGPRVPAWEAFVRKRPKPFTKSAVQPPIFASQLRTFRFSGSSRPDPVFQCPRIERLLSSVAALLRTGNTVESFVDST